MLTVGWGSGGFAWRHSMCKAGAGARAGASVVGGGARRQTGQRVRAEFAVEGLRRLSLRRLWVALSCMICFRIP